MNTATASLQFTAHRYFRATLQRLRLADDGPDDFDIGVALSSADWRGLAQALEATLAINPGTGGSVIWRADNMGSESILLVTNNVAAVTTITLTDETGAAETQDLDNASLYALAEISRMMAATL